jgi:hypothetical protein
MGKLRDGYDIMMTVINACNFFGLNAIRNGEKLLKRMIRALSV